MMNFLKSICLAALLVSVASALSPTHERLRRTVGIALSAVFLAVLLHSLGGVELSVLFPTVREEFAEGDTAVWEEVLREGVEEGIRADLDKRFFLQSEETVVRAELYNAEGEVTLVSVRVVLCGTDVLADARGIAAYIEKEYGASCEVTLGG